MALRSTGYGDWPTMKGRLRARPAYQLTFLVRRDSEPNFLLVEAKGLDRLLWYLETACLSPQHRVTRYDACNVKAGRVRWKMFQPKSAVKVRGLAPAHMEGVSRDHPT